MLDLRVGEGSPAFLLVPRAVPDYQSFHHGSGRSRPRS